MMKLVWLCIGAGLAILAVRSLPALPTVTAPKVIAPNKQEQPRTKTTNELIADGRAILAEGDRQRALQKISALDAFEARWLNGVQAAARAEYVHFCGFRSIDWQMRVQGLVEGGMAQDPRFGRFTDAERAEILRWRDLVRLSEIERIGPNGIGCRSVIGQPWVADLDGMTYQ